MQPQTQRLENTQCTEMKHKHNTPKTLTAHEAIKYQQPTKNQYWVDYLAINKKKINKSSAQFTTFKLYF